jgi:hypothetical protein
MNQYVTGSKRIVAVGPSSQTGVRDDDQPAGVAHAVPGPAVAGSATAACGAAVLALPNRPWREPALGVHRCRECEKLTADPTPAKPRPRRARSTAGRRSGPAAAARA